MMNLLKDRQIAWGVAIALCGIAGNSNADCQSATAEALPTASRAVEQWQAARRISLTVSARDRFDSTLCQSVSEVADETGADPRDIDAASHDAVFAYLDASSSEGGKVDLKSSLAAKFVFNASPALPETGFLGVIAITYDHQVDLIKVGGSTMAPVSAILVEIGNVSIAGLQTNRVVCSATVTVRPGSNVNFKC